MNNQLISLNDIIVGDRLRPVDQSRVDSLTESIGKIGMKTPITVLPVPGSNPPKYRLVAGNHRFEAQRQLGRGHVDAIIMIGNDKQAQLWEIDENLCRNELTPAERAAHVARRKAIYLELHPETAQFVAGGRARQETASDNLSFAAETAKATGRDERTVQREAERGEKVIPEVINLITGTKLDTGAYLDKLKRLPPNEQMTAAKRDLAADRRTSSPAAPAAEPNRLQDSPAIGFEDMRKAILLLCGLKAEDILRLCPAGNQRAGMMQRISHLQQTFEQVIEQVAE
jgi:ParB-like chromosome segregation protein Spo0J